MSNTRAGFSYDAVMNRENDLKAEIEAVRRDRDALLEYARICDAWIHEGDVGVWRQMDRARKRVSHLLDGMPDTGAEE